MISKELFRPDCCAANLGIQSSDSSTQALGDDLGVVLQGCLGVGMSEVALHIFHSRVALHVSGRGAPECLMREIVDSDLLCQGFQIPLQIIANTERCSG